MKKNILIFSFLLISISSLSIQGNNINSNIYYTEINANTKIEEASIINLKHAIEYILAFMVNNGYFSDNQSMDNPVFRSEIINLALNNRDLQNRILPIIRQEIKLDELRNSFYSQKEMAGTINYLSSLIFFPGIATKSITSLKISGAVKSNLLQLGENFSDILVIIGGIGKFFSNLIEYKTNSRIDSINKEMEFIENERSSIQSFIFQKILQIVHERSNIEEA